MSTQNEEEADLPLPPPQEVERLRTEKAQFLQEIKHIWNRKRTNSLPDQHPGTGASKDRSEQRDTFFGAGKESGCCMC